MKILVQRVSRAGVQVDGKEVGAIGFGVLVFVGITQGDAKENAVWLAQKLAHLRIFSDDQDKLNLSLLEKEGSALIVSQFTLYADCSEGRRPSFTKAASPELAKGLYEEFVSEVEKLGINVQTGIFGAKMQVSLVNDGPMTLIVER
jgi:D-tyrosyl-tRNA(Tyr) deacylase